jgi:hypothetical protein
MNASELTGIEDATEEDEEIGAGIVLELPDGLSRVDDPPPQAQSTDSSNPDRVSLDRLLFTTFIWSGVLYRYRDK